MPPAAPLRRGGVYAGPSPESEIIIEAGRFRCKVVAPQKVSKLVNDRLGRWLETRNEPNRRETDGRTDEQTVGKEKQKQMVQMVRLL